MRYIAGPSTAAATTLRISLLRAGSTVVERPLLRHHLRPCLRRSGPRGLLIAGASKPRIALGRTSHVALLGGKLGLLLGVMLRLLRVCSLRGALGLLALITLSLVDGLGHRLAAVSRLHLRPLLFSGVDGSDQPPRGRRSVFGGIQRNQRRASHAGHVFLLAGRQVRRHGAA